MNKEETIHINGRDEKSEVQKKSENRKYVICNRRRPREGGGYKIFHKKTEQMKREIEEGEKWNEKNRWKFKMRGMRGQR